METTIKDSGNRTTFYDEEGNPLGQRDIQEDKGRCDLLPLKIVANTFSCMRLFARGEADVIYKISDFMETGDAIHLYKSLVEFCKYQGWSLTECFLEVSMHYKQGALKYGERNWEKGIPLHSFIDSAVRHLLKHIDGCTDERHDRAFVWNILGALWTIYYKRDTKLIDVPFELVSGKVSEVSERKEVAMVSGAMTEFFEKRNESNV